MEFKEGDIVKCLLIGNTFCQVRDTSKSFNSAQIFYFNPVDGKFHTAWVYANSLMKGEPSWEK